MDTEQEKVLVVDDEESIRRLLKLMLEDCGLTVVTAADGEEALYKLALEKTNLVLLDISMPKMSGLEVLKRLSESAADICVIMVTADADISTAVETLKLGAYDYITKPFDQLVVKEKVQNALQKWRRISQEKRRYLKLNEAFSEQSQRMQQQFTELVDSLAREHRMMMKFVESQPGGGKELLAKLPKELQKSMASIEEFRDALIRILRGASK
jgi:DNA-binding NtrC family response regulator